jgi:hypothetical protein
MRSDFGKRSVLAAAVLGIVLAAAPACFAQQALAQQVLAQQVLAQQVLAQQAEPATKAAKPINAGDVLSGELNAMRLRGGKQGKRVATYQLTSEPRRLPPPNGLCGLETGPETFQIVTNSDAQAAQLKNFVGKEVSLQVDEVACAQDAGQMSEAVVTKWSVVTKH